MSESGNIRVYMGLFNSEKVARMVDAELREGYDLMTIAGSSGAAGSMWLTVVFKKAS